jgi:hypothetical protein
MNVRGYDFHFLFGEARKLLIMGRWRELIRKFRLLSSGASGGGVNRLGIGSIAHIWSSPHTLFLANQLVESLNEMGIRAEVIDKVGGGTGRPDLEIVLSPAFFNFPFTRSPRIVFQLEQTTSNRWFTPEYINYMNNSLAVFEYSHFNLDRLREFGVDPQKIYLVPLGGSTRVFKQSMRLRSKETRTDKKIVAYGDFSGSPRRARFVKYAKDNTPSFVVHSEIFGETMAQELESSEVVVHVNYYAPAILATPRLWESISRGCRIVSEKAINWTEDPYLLELVDFVEVEEFDAILEHANQLIKTESGLKNRLSTVESSELRFRFMLARGLFGVGALGEAELTRKIKLERLEPGHPIILSLPETTGRHKGALELMPGESIIFAGVKQSPGWVGCANSYKFLAKALLAEGVSMVAICEDDVLLPENFKSKMSLIWEYLEGLDMDWDIFVGLTADFSHKTKISGIQEYKGERFIHSDKFTSTVFNIYSKRGLEKLASWENNPNLSVEQNTIDRAISSFRGLNIVSLEKDIFGHDSDSQSTLWGINNSVYDDMFLRSSYIKAGLIREFELAKLK